MKLLDRAPRWDKHRDTFLKVGLLCSLTFVLTAFNYTSYAPKLVYEYAIEPVPEIMEVIPPRTKIKKVLPPPPKPIIETSPDILPKDDVEFIEDTPIETETKENIALPIDNNTLDVNPVPPVVDIIIPDEPIEEGPVIIAERMPIYNTCDIEVDESLRRKCTQEKMLKHIYSRLKYPAIARESNITGMVVISFVVDKSGQVQSPEIVKDIGGGCGQAVLRVIDSLEGFFPGKQNGRPVSVIYRIPVRFELE